MKDETRKEIVLNAAVFGGLALGTLGICMLSSTFFGLVPFFFGASYIVCDFFTNKPSK